VAETRLKDFCKNPESHAAVAGGGGAVVPKLAGNFQETGGRRSGKAVRIDAVGVDNPMPRLLVVDDEPNIRELLSVSLRFSGFDVATAATGREAIEAAERDHPDLVVLDVMLPDMDGFHVARRLREIRHVPIVFLTARDAVEDKITGLTLGGDDYVTKPFSLEEVVARIRSVLRRTRGEAAAASSGRHRFADLELDEESHEVWRAGRHIELSPTEFKLLRYLMLNNGRVLSKAQIIDRVWNYDFAGQHGIVESYVSFLRHKIDRDGPRLIHTVRGIGYLLREPREGG
jgi:two-component system, OmpR family, response regulator